MSINSGFWDLPADERAAAMDAACERAGAGNFWDLDPEERAAAYDRAVTDYWATPSTRSRRAPHCPPRQPPSSPSPVP